MKITKKILERIIKEEFARILSESDQNSTVNALFHELVKIPGVDAEKIASGLGAMAGDIQKLKQEIKDLKTTL